MTMRKGLALSLLSSAMLFGCGGDDAETNYLPLFQVADATTKVGELFTMSNFATDADGDQLSYSFDGLPSWLSYDEASQSLSGTPQMGQEGNYAFTIHVSDGSVSSSKEVNLEVKLIGDWKLAWSDEFDGNALDSNNWSPMLGDGSEYGLVGWGNNELQYYKAENATVADGKLSITALEEVTAGYNYSSARLRTAGKFDTKYGRIEVKAKAPEGQGLWSAVWMLPTDSMYGGWASGGEIDIMEVVSAKGDVNQKTHGTVHYGMAWPFNQNAGGMIDAQVTDDFHTYAIEWEQNEIRWYFDGQHYATVTKDAWWSYFYKDMATGYESAPEAPFDQDFHLLINLAVGGNWPGSPDGDTAFPSALEVDYVRVYDCEYDGVPVASCANNVSDTVEPAPERSVYVAEYPLFTGSGEDKISWTTAAGPIEAPLAVGAGWDNNGALSMTLTADPERGDVIDITTTDMGNVLINAAEGGTFALRGMGNSQKPWELAAAELKFELFIDSSMTNADGNILIKMDSGWPNLGFKSLAISDLKMDEWQSLSVPVNDLVATPGDGPLDMAAVVNLFVIEFSSNAHVMVDNITLKCAHPADNGCAIDPPPQEISDSELPVFINGVNTGVWDNGVGAWDDAIQTDYFDGTAGGHMGWEIVDSGEDGHDQVLQITSSDSGASGLVFIQASTPQNLSGFAGGTLEFDLKVADYGSNTSGMTFKVDCIYPCTTGDQPLGVVADGEWQSFSISLDDLVAKGLNLKTVNTGLVIYPAWGDQAGVTFWVDNIKWVKGEGAVDGGDTPAAPGPVGDVTLFTDTEDANWKFFICCANATSTIADVGGDNGNVAEFNFSGTGGTVVGFINENGNDLSGLTNGTLEFDFKMTSAPTNTEAVWKLKVEGASQSIFAELDLSAGNSGVGPVLDQWQKYTFNLSDLESAGLDLSLVKIVMIFPEWQKADGAAYQIDNVVFKDGLQ
ncbi:family 16 glycosylhydrolase [Paraferrimonas sp. SM1919]|uniref:family 16 glycosylhydrolase n=1 Tax=Paraferrimonas sp. SM1919 TaxID=2662263 RepID=UPI0013D3DA1F|nr:family 16 glycosylhydrolase [Paraferrimonas sp. SM1919]